MIDDFDLIVASFQSQYGIRLSKELETMKWNEFRSYLVGISPDTPLGRIVAIRAETDTEILKNFTKEQKKIRSEWLNKAAKQKGESETEMFLEDMKRVFIQLAGGGKH